MTITQEQHQAMVKRLDAEIARMDELLAAKQADLETASESERTRLWQALKPYWRGDMGPAHIIVKEIEHLFNP